MKNGEKVALPYQSVKEEHYKKYSIASIVLGILSIVLSSFFHINFILYYYDFILYIIQWLISQFQYKNKTHTLP